MTSTSEMFFRIITNRPLRSYDVGLDGTNQPYVFYKFNGMNFSSNTFDRFVTVLKSTYPGVNIYLKQDNYNDSYYCKIAFDLERFKDPIQVKDALEQIFKEVKVGMDV
jgi:hypothetical protein